jgi:hypothetical protein
MENAKIEEVSRKLESEVSQLIEDPSSSFHSLMIPPDYQPEILLQDKAGRKKKRNASLANWSPRSGDEIRIRFALKPALSELPRQPETVEVPAPRPAGVPVDVSAPARGAEPSPSVAAIAEVVRALDRAESRPGFQFVALKWFRDLFLPGEGFRWTQSESSRQEVLKEAILARLVLTSKVPNPKAPQFPVTAIRLNRLLSEVQAILAQVPKQENDFDPVSIRGEDLSATVLRERR